MYDLLHLHYLTADAILKIWSKWKHTIYQKRKRYVFVLFYYCTSSGPHDLSLSQVAAGTEIDLPLPLVRIQNRLAREENKVSTQICPCPHGGGLCGFVRACDLNIQLTKHRINVVNSNVLC